MVLILKQMEEKAPRYVDWICRVIRPWLGDDVLEIGAGIGTYTKRMAQNGRRVTAIDINPVALGVLRQAVSEFPKVTVIAADASGPVGMVPMRNGGFDTIVCLNVLEHIEDDAKTLNNFAQWLRSGGRMVLMVPAAPMAYGSFDRAIGHFRRYRLGPLREMVERAGFEVLKSHYFNSVGLFAWIWMGLVCGRQELNLGQVYLYDRLVVPILSAIEWFVKPPFGQSVFVMAKKI